MAGERNAIAGRIHALLVCVVVATLHIVRGGLRSASAEHATRKQAGTRAHDCATAAVERRACSRAECRTYHGAAHRADSSSE